MPPEEAHKTFTPEQKETFKRWVAEGAEYEPHWAYTPLVRPVVPSRKTRRHGDAETRRKILLPISQSPRLRVFFAIRSMPLSRKSLPRRTSCHPARLTGARFSGVSRSI